MKFRILSVLLALLFVVASETAAQDTNHDGLVTFLVPINVPFAAPGAYGTLWKSELWIHNGTNFNFVFHPCNLGPCPVHEVGTTELAFELETLSAIGPVMLSIPSAELPNIDFSSRLFELSRHTQPAGVHMPIVREDRFFTTPSRFIGISGSAANRVALRIYDPRRRRDSVVRIEALDSGGHVIADRLQQLFYSDSTREPGYAALTDLAAVLPQLSGAGRYDLRVTPLTPGMEYWAMVSVTDVETQQVLLITAD